MSSDELEQVKREAFAAVARIYDEPRLAQAAFDVAAATDQLSREERVVVLIHILQPTLAQVSAELLVEALSVLSMAQHPVNGLAAIAWVELARTFGVTLARHPHHV
ncbi:MAG TPA: hypothetical protein VGR82_17760 [Methylomirabilota bacterium]|jgi:hypothetical protein|nr:hypothetical protein [Methylomirabilota bacterium]